ncbi:single-stranded DNA-binding protein [Mesorhizobium sp. J428]|uniref:single-stranded DNA-binding protein n=1 Tax=Mesorhizobium sp. J428 TaxID=2898440 RepID=UPI002150BCB4|nr:single-stranded DNA-binding protein [Mesorhizobium sp. J428]MCR5860126.1 single-stranded DNA-binding protein [Mesorhizobium sp. J428]MCR5860156.1 single-stranded DNA-binding protein [Mesorhizobium sp. J428]MCR5860190.1 single-stranded DNA-binding protein [Mesorhizobium sp. J428]MCR5860219.1 single-stranded DNA-binding protein [Mesorhizobium sp. J428]
MQSNTFAGRLADAPALRRTASGAVCRFTLISNEYAGKDDNNNSLERAVRVQFVAFNKKGEAIAENCRRGDQLIVQWSLRNNDYQDSKTGETVYGFDFRVEDFEFGAPGSIKRAELQERQGAN